MLLNAPPTCNSSRARLRQPTKPRAHVIPRYAPIFASNFSASSPSMASQNRSSKSLKVLGSPLRYSLTASSIKTTLKIELDSARLIPSRFAIPCLVMYLLSAPADNPDLSQGRRLIAHPLVPARRSEPRDRAELRRVSDKMMALTLAAEPIKRVINRSQLECDHADSFGDWQSHL